MRTKMLLAEAFLTAFIALAVKVGLALGHITREVRFLFHV
jgi:hypothetical protein